MKWIVYLFILAVSLGLLRLDNAKAPAYLAWVVLALLVGFGMLWL